MVGYLGAGTFEHGGWCQVQAEWWDAGYLGGWKLWNLETWASPRLPRLPRQALRCLASRSLVPSPIGSTTKFLGNNSLTSHNDP